MDEIIPTALTLVPTGTETGPGEHVRNFAQTEPITVISAGEGFHAPVEVIRPRNSILADYFSYRDQTGLIHELPLWMWWPTASVGSSR